MTTTEKRMTKAAQDRQDTFLIILKALDAAETDPDRHISIQIDDALRDAIKAAQTSGEVANVSIKIKVKPGPDRRVHFIPSVKGQLPRPPVPAAYLVRGPRGWAAQQRPQADHLRPHPQPTGELTPMPTNLPNTESLTPTGDLADAIRSIINISSEASVPEVEMVKVSDGKGGSVEIPVAI